jgi:hypothetical protein
MRCFEHEDGLFRRLKVLIPDVGAIIAFCIQVHYAPKPSKDYRYGLRMMFFFSEPVQCIQ